MNYYVISSGEDGITIAGPLDKEEIIKQINRDYWGENVTYLSKIPENYDNYLNEGIIIIKGQIVTPKPVNIKYDI